MLSPRSDRFKRRSADAYVGLHLPRGTLAVEQVIRQFRALGLDAGCVYHALFTKSLECDLESAPINIHTPVWRSES